MTRFFQNQGVGTRIFGSGLFDDDNSVYDVQAEKLSVPIETLRTSMAKQINDPLRVARSQGHRYEAYAVATSPKYYILSGGADCTTRVWRFFDQPLTCYRLIGVIVHNHPVSAVSLTSRDYPRKPLVMSATYHDGLFFWDMQRDKVSKHSMKGVTHMDCKKEEQHKEGFWLLAVAAGFEAYLIEVKDQNLSVSVLGTFSEEEHIRQVANIPGELDDGAAIATCTNYGVTLWSLKGVKLAVLSEPAGKQIRGFSLSDEDGGWTVIVTGGEDELSVWTYPKGKLRATAADMELCPAPLVQYNIKESVRRVAIVMDNDKNSHKWMFVTRQDSVSQLLDVVPDDDRPAIGDTGLNRRLVQRAHVEIASEVNHRGMVNALSFFTDPEQDELRLVVALDDSRLIVWDLVGNDAGQIVAKLRSIPTWELYMPIVVGIVFFVQMSILAFGPSTKWGKGVKGPGDAVYTVALLDVEVLFKLHGAPIFWARSISVVTMMVFFIIVCLLDMPELIIRRKQWVETRYGVKSFTYKFLTVLNFAIRILTQGSVTVLAMPTYKTFAHIYDCEPSADGGPSTIKTAPELNCLEGGHLALAILVAPVGILYSVLLVPHFVVNGDNDYVLYGSTDLLRPSALKRNAERYSTTTYKGFVHPCKQYAIVHSLSDLSVKIAMPAIAILMTQTPVPQMIILTVIATLHFVLSVVCRQYVDRATATFFRGMRVLTVGFMFAGLLTVIDDGEHSQEALILLIIIVTVVVPATSVIVLFYRWRSTQDPSSRIEVRLEDEEGQGHIGKKRAW